MSHDSSSVGEMVSDKVLRLNERRIRPTPRGRGVSGFQLEDDHVDGPVAQILREVRHRRELPQEILKLRREVAVHFL